MKIKLDRFYSMYFFGGKKKTEKPPHHNEELFKKIAIPGLYSNLSLAQHE